MKRSAFLKNGAVLISAVLLSETVLTNIAQANVWDDRRAAVRSTAKKETPVLAGLPFPVSPLSSLSKSSVPSRLTTALPALAVEKLTPLFHALQTGAGNIQRVTRPASATGRVVVHIQDVHMNAEAQTNIGKTVAALIDEKQVGVIGLEGAFAQLPIDKFQRFSDQAAVRDVAQALFAESKISGPVYAGLIGKTQLPSFIGIDNRAHYEANVNAYRASRADDARVKKQFDRAKRALVEKKKDTFNKDLRAFDEKADAYRAGSMGLGAYVKLLSSFGTPVTAQVKIFREAMALESSLDFKRVDQERSRVLTRLLGKLTDAQVKDVVNHSVAYRMGRLTNADFYDYLGKLCAEHQIDLAATPMLSAYLRYVLLSDQIHVEPLFADLKQMEQAAYARLATTAAEKDLIEESRRVYLTGKLIAFSLTPEEWKDYVLVHSPWTIDHGPNFSPYEKFYEEADARNAYLATNLLKAMDMQHASNAVLVTGGFHTTEIEVLLEKAGVTVITFAPKITKVDTENGAAYLSAFNQEKTPLDRLFEGRDLFTAPDPMSQALLTGGTIGRAVQNGMPAPVAARQLVPPSVTTRVTQDGSATTVEMTGPEQTSDAIKLDDSNGALTITRETKPKRGGLWSTYWWYVPIGFAVETPGFAAVMVGIAWKNGDVSWLFLYGPIFLGVHVFRFLWAKLYYGYEFDSEAFNRDVLILAGHKLIVSILAISAWNIIQYNTWLGAPLGYAWMAVAVIYLGYVTWLHYQMNADWGKPLTIPSIFTQDFSDNQLQRLRDSVEAFGFDLVKDLSDVLYIAMLWFSFLGTTAPMKMMTKPWFPPPDLKEHANTQLPEGGANFMASALDPEHIYPLLSVVDFQKNIHKSHDAPKFRKLSRQVKMRVNPLDGGLGKNYPRKIYKKNHFQGDEKNRIGAKGTDLLHHLQVWKINSDGSKEKVDLKISIAELKLLQLLSLRDDYAGMTFEPLVNPESEASYSALVNEIYLGDELDDRVLPLQKRTYREVLESAGIDFPGFRSEKSIPKIKVEKSNGETEFSLPLVKEPGDDTKSGNDAPGGHGRGGFWFFMKALKRAKERRATRVKTDVRSMRVFHNGDNLNSRPNNEIVGHMIDKKHVVNLIVTPAEFIDKKGGKIGIRWERNALGHLIAIPDIVETAKAKEMKQMEVFQEMGQVGGLGDAGKQLFNTNQIYIDEDKLGDILFDLRKILGRRKKIDPRDSLRMDLELAKAFSPTAIHATKEDPPGYLQVEAPISSVLFNLNAFFLLNAHDAEISAVLKKHGTDRLVHLVNVPRMEVFTPEKSPLDNLYKHSDRFVIQSDNINFSENKWALFDTQEGQPMPDLALMADPALKEPSGVYKDDVKQEWDGGDLGALENLLGTKLGLQFAKRVYFNGAAIYLPNANYIGYVRITNRSQGFVDKRVTDLTLPGYMDKFRQASQYCSVAKDGRVTFENVHVTIEDNNVSFLPYNLDTGSGRHRALSQRSPSQGGGFAILADWYIPWAHWETPVSVLLAGTFAYGYGNVWLMFLSPAFFLTIHLPRFAVWVFYLTSRYFTSAPVPVHVQNPFNFDVWRLTAGKAGIAALIIAGIFFHEWNSPFGLLMAMFGFSLIMPLMLWHEEFNRTDRRLVRLLIQDGVVPDAELIARQLGVSVERVKAAVLKSLDQIRKQQFDYSDQMPMGRLIPRLVELLNDARLVIALRKAGLTSDDYQALTLLTRDPKTLNETEKTSLQIAKTKINLFNSNEGRIPKILGKRSEQTLSELTQKTFPIEPRVSVDEIKQFLRDVAAGKYFWGILSGGLATRLGLPTMSDLGIAGLSVTIVRKVREGQKNDYPEDVAAAARGQLNGPERSSILQLDFAQLAYQLEDLALMYPDAGVTPQQVRSGIRAGMFPNDMNSQTLQNQVASLQPGFPVFNQEEIMVGQRTVENGAAVIDLAARTVQGHGDAVRSIYHQTVGISVLNGNGKFKSLKSQTMYQALKARGVQYFMLGQVNDLHILRDPMALTRWLTARRAMAKTGAKMVFELLRNNTMEKVKDAEGKEVLKRQKGGMMIPDEIEPEFGELRDTPAFLTPDLARPELVSRMFYMGELDALADVDWDSETDGLPRYINVQAGKDGKVRFKLEAFSGDASSLVPTVAMEDPNGQRDNFKALAEQPRAEGAMEGTLSQVGFWDSVQSQGEPRYSDVYMAAKLHALVLKLYNVTNIYFQAALNKRTSESPLHDPERLINAIEILARQLQERAPPVRTRSENRELPNLLEEIALGAARLRGQSLYLLSDDPTRRGQINTAIQAELLQLYRRTLVAVDAFRSHLHATVDKGAGPFVRSPGTNVAVEGGGLWATWAWYKPLAPYLETPLSVAAAGGLAIANHNPGLWFLAPAFFVAGHLFRFGKWLFYVIRERRTGEPVPASVENPLNFTVTILTAGKTSIALLGFFASSLLESNDALGFVFGLLTLVVILGATVGLTLYHQELNDGDNFRYTRTFKYPASQDDGKTSQAAVTYPKEGFDVTVKNPNLNYARTSQGAVSVGMSMLARALHPDKADYPGVIIAPSGDWVGQDGANLMQIYFAIAANFNFHKRKTEIVCTAEQKERILEYLRLGNSYELKNKAGYPDEVMERLYREAIYLADRTALKISPDGTVDDKGPIRMLTPADKDGESDPNEYGMIRFRILNENGEASVGNLQVRARPDGRFNVYDGSRIHRLRAPQQDLQVSFSGVAPMTARPDFGFTFLGQSSGMDANGLTSNQILWAGKHSFLIDIGAATVDEMKALGLTPRDISHVILTHMHEDHVAGALRYFQWAKQYGQPIKLAMEPGIYDDFYHQALQLGVDIEQRFGIEKISLPFNKTKIFGKGINQAVVIEPIAAFHGTATLGLRATYQGRTISHSSDTVLDIHRFKKILHNNVPAYIRADLDKAHPLLTPGARVFDEGRAKELTFGFFKMNEANSVPSLVNFEIGAPAFGLDNNSTNHTAPIQLNYLPMPGHEFLGGLVALAVLEKIWTHHTAKLPDGQTFKCQLARPLSTIRLDDQKPIVLFSSPAHWKGPGFRLWSTGIFAVAISDALLTAGLLILILVLVRHAIRWGRNYAAKRAAQNDLEKGPKLTDDNSDEMPALPGQFDVENVRPVTEGTKTPDGKIEVFTQKGYPLLQKLVGRVEVLPNGAIDYESIARGLQLGLVEQLNIVNALLRYIVLGSRGKERSRKLQTVERRLAEFQNDVQLRMAFDQIGLTRDDVKTLNDLFGRFKTDPNGLDVAEHARLKAVTDKIDKFNGVGIDGVPFDAQTEDVQGIINILDTNLSTEDRVAHVRRNKDGVQAQVVSVAGMGSAMKLPAKYNNLRIAGLTLELLLAFKQGGMKVYQDLWQKASDMKDINRPEEMSLLQFMIAQYLYQNVVLALQTPQARVSLTEILAGLRFVYISNQEQGESLRRQVEALNLQGTTVVNMTETMVPTRQGNKDGSTVPNPSRSAVRGHGQAIGRLPRQAYDVYVLSSRGQMVEAPGQTVVDVLEARHVKEVGFRRIVSSTFDDIAAVARWEAARRLGVFDASNRMFIEAEKNSDPTDDRGGFIFENNQASEPDAVLVRDYIGLRNYPNLTFDTISLMAYWQSLESMKNALYDAAPYYLQLGWNAEADGGKGAVEFKIETKSGDVSSELLTFAGIAPNEQPHNFRRIEQLDQMIATLTKVKDQPGFWEFVEGLKNPRSMQEFLNIQLNTILAEPLAPNFIQIRDRLTTADHIVGEMIRRGGALNPDERIQLNGIATKISEVSAGLSEHSLEAESWRTLQSNIRELQATTLKLESDIKVNPLQMAAPVGVGMFWTSEWWQARAVALETSRPYYMAFVVALVLAYFQQTVAAGIVAFVPAAYFVLGHVPRFVYGVINGIPEHRDAFNATVGKLTAAKIALSATLAYSLSHLDPLNAVAVAGVVVTFFAAIEALARWHTSLNEAAKQAQAAGERTALAAFRASQGILTRADAVALVAENLGPSRANDLDNIANVDGDHGAIFARAFTGSETGHQKVFVRAFRQRYERLTGRSVSGAEIRGVLIAAIGQASVAMPLSRVDAALQNGNAAQPVLNIVDVPETLGTADVVAYVASFAEQRKKLPARITLHTLFLAPTEDLAKAIGVASAAAKLDAETAVVPAQDAFVGLANDGLGFLVARAEANIPTKWQGDIPVFVLRQGAELVYDGVQTRHLLNSQVVYYDVAAVLQAADGVVRQNMETFRQLDKLAQMWDSGA